MIGSTLIEEKVATLFLFLSIETGLFQVERALPKPTLLTAGCPASARRWQAPFNPKQSRFDG